MKQICKKFIVWILQWQAKLYVKKNQPQIILIYGSINRLKIKDELLKSLNSNKLNIRANIRGYNSEIGIPLTILNLRAGFSSIFKWLILLITGFKKLIFKSNISEIIILEFVADNLIELKKILFIVKPKIIVISDFLAKISKKESISIEIYEELINSISKEGIVLIEDNLAQLISLNEYQNVFVYGISAQSDIRAVNIKEFDSKQEFIYQYKNLNQKVILENFSIFAVYNYLIVKFLRHYIIDELI